MPTEYNTHLSQFHENQPPRVWDQGLVESLDYWEEYVSGRNSPEQEVKTLVEMLNKLQKEGKLDPVKRREYWMMYREGPREDQEWVYEEVTRLFERFIKMSSG